MNTHELDKPTKKPTHLTKYTTQNHTEKLEEEDWNVH